MKDSLIVFIIFCFSITFSITQDIYEASRKGNIELIRSLSKINKDTINTTNKSGYSPLIIAGYRNQMEAVKVLLELGANVNAISEEGTVLTAACYRSNMELVKLLLQHHADVNIKNMDGTTPLMFAIMAENEELVFLLIQQGADTKAVDYSNKSVIDYARACENSNIKQLFNK